MDPMEGALDKIYDYIDANSDKRLLRDQLNINFALPEGSPFDLLSEVFQFEETVTPPTTDTGPGTTVTGQVSTISPVDVKFREATLDPIEKLISEGTR